LLSAYKEMGCLCLWRWISFTHTRFFWKILVLWQSWWKISTRYSSYESKMPGVLEMN